MVNILQARFIFWHENFCILLQVSYEFVPNGPINKKTVLVRIMA